MILSNLSCSEEGHQMQTAQGHVQLATEYLKVEIAQLLWETCSSVRILSLLYFFS